MLFIKSRSPCLSALCEGARIVAIFLSIFGRTLIFALALLPGFIPVTLHYFCSCTRKSVRYGSQSCRQACDVYLPRSGFSSSNAVPVVLFVTGGGWVIGYKMWGLVMGYVFQRNGILFVSIDYRNYPQATVPTMVADLELALLWLVENAAAYGGNPDDISLVGQSAGAHLSALLLVKQAARTSDTYAQNYASTSVEESGYAPPRVVLRRWVGISGVYNLSRLMDDLGNRFGLDEQGAHTRLFERVMGSALPQASPTQLVQNLGDQGRLQSLLPPLALFHGTADKTANCEQAREFASALRAVGCRVHEMYFDGATHTDPILESPFSGDDPLMVALLAMVTEHATVESGSTRTTAAPGALLPRMVPAPMIACARWVNAF